MSAFFGMSLLVALVLLPFVVEVRRSRRGHYGHALTKG